MSLKAFHIFFVVMAMLSSISFGAWALRHSWVTPSPAYGAVACFAALFAIGLLVYGVWFLRKLKHVSFL